MIKILHEDNHLIIVNKACGDIVQGDATGDSPMSDHVKTWIKEKYNKPGDVFLGVTHRLDRPTSGIVIFARTSKALARMNELFREGNIKKKYLAVVDKLPEKQSDTLTHFIVRNEKQNKSYAHDKHVPNAKEARLTYKVLASSDRFHLLEIDLHTGRHHQIRAQLAAIGCHIKGDLKYGFPRSNPDAGIHLHAYKAEFTHPVKQEILHVTAPPPDDVLWNFFRDKLE